MLSIKRSWGLGIGDWAQSPIPNPQSPIPNPTYFSKVLSITMNYRSLIIKVIMNILLINKGLFIIIRIFYLFDQ